jgi:hypothetical protein
MTTMGKQPADDVHGATMQQWRVTTFASAHEHEQPWAKREQKNVVAGQE